MELALNGKVALVTGVSRKIGAAVATELAREAMDLCLAARDSDKLKQLARDLRCRSSVRVYPFSPDLRDPAAPNQAIAQTVAELGRLDLLANNAGAAKRGDFFSLTDEDWNDGFVVKFHGYVRVVRPARPHLRDNSGSIVNIVPEPDRLNAPSADQLMLRS